MKDALDLQELSYLFCYICKKYTSLKENRTLTSVKRLYRIYFAIELEDKRKAWGPHIACVNWIFGFSHWIKGKRNSSSSNYEDADV